jgi:hypothetical protein
MDRLVGITLVCVTVLSSPLPAETAAPTKGQAAVVRFARSAAVRALNFEQGNLKSLLDARDDFTPGGWDEFMKHMKGYVDDQGVPQFSQSFVASSDPVVIDEKDAKDGIVHLTIRGKLKQTHDSSSTTYEHVEIDIRVAVTPMRIQHLEPTIVLLRSK